MAVNRAYTRKNRTNKGTGNDTGAIQSYEANPYSGGKKSLKVGPDFCKQDTNAFISGRDVSAGGNILPGSILYFYNNSATVAWVAISSASIGAAPTNFATGIPLPPNAWTVLSAGENQFVYSSASTVGLYDVKDDSNLNTSPASAQP